ncbi:hypothetical protein BDZ45DRAFT_750314 [Acephala macrosclerotiorum]|nr:hypothetical protein BDZ45DRAFT_750314 [Acephala macrosclerotiorum]
MRHSITPVDFPSTRNWRASGVVSSGVVTGTETALPSGFVASTVVAGATVTPSSSIYTTTPTSSQTPNSAPSSTPTATLGGGAIAGIIIGGGALTFAFVLALVFLIKKMNRTTPGMYEPGEPTARADPHASYLTNQIVHA